ncbi:MAG: hypothetical protein U1E16_11195 [Hyphomicrobiales bacterium]
MNFTALTRAAVFTAGLVLAASLAGAAEPANQHVPLQKTIGKPQNQGPVPSLGVINSDGATLEGNTLTLTGVTQNVIIFADRPVRAAGHETTEVFISRWGEGKDSFKSDPPNATVSVLGGEKDGVTDAVVVLKSPKLDGTTLTFDVDVLEGDLKGLKGPAAVFIDWFAAGGGHGGWAVGGAGWHGGYHAWYGAPVAAGVAAGAVAGAAIGAAAAAPYYAPPACGYYPYPPCY